MPRTLLPRRWARTAFTLALASGAPFGARAATDFETGVLDEINFVRAHPLEYARWLRSAEQPTPATLEAADQLERTAPLGPVQFNPALGASAAKHAGDGGAYIHTGSDGSSASERMHREGVWASIMAEDISFGQFTPRDVIRQLIVDENVPARDHRADLLHPMLRMAGVGCGPHAVWGAVCVIDMSTLPPSR